MASQDDELGAPAEFELRDDDRPSATGYGYDRRPSRSFAFFGVGMLLVGIGSRTTSSMTAIRTAAATQQRRQHWYCRNRMASQDSAHSLLGATRETSGARADC